MAKFMGEENDWDNDRLLKPCRFYHDQENSDRCNTHGWPCALGVLHTASV